jgi:hypothetical protein
LSQHGAANTYFENIMVFVPAASRTSKAETVVMLIMWILILSKLLAWPFEALGINQLPAFLRNILQTIIFVVSISYALLPFSSHSLTRFKAH